jgi:hypothetical protein
MEKEVSVQRPLTDEIAALVSEVSTLLVQHAACVVLIIWMEAVPNVLVSSLLLVILSEARDQGLVIAPQVPVALVMALDRRAFYVALSRSTCHVALDAGLCRVAIGLGLRLAAAPRRPPTALALRT